MSRLLSILLLSLLVVTAVFVPNAYRPAIAQSTANIQVEFRGQVTVNGSNNVKFPQIKGRGAIAHLAGSGGGSGNNNSPLYWRKNADGTTNFPSPADLGSTNGEPQFAVSDVAIAPSGRVYVIWNHTGDNAIYMLSSSDGASWNTGDRKTVIDDSSFRVYTRVGASNNRLWVVWNQDGRYRYRTTTDITGGSGWSGTILLSSRESINQPSIAVSPDGSRAAIAYGGSNGNIYVGIWNGSSFVEKTVSDTSEYLADPTVAIGPDNRIWVAWRAVEGTVYFAREDDNKDANGNGGYPRGQVRTAEAYGQVSISIDPQGTPHVFWVGNRGDGWKGYYARQVEGQWYYADGNPGAFIANGSGTNTVSDFAYGHGVSEYFSGSTVSTRYYLFRSPGGCQVTISIPSVVPGANPPIVNGTTVSGTLTPSSGCTPDQQRVALNAPDTNQAATTWTAAFSNLAISNLKQCQQTVYAQVRPSGSTGFSTWSSATFIADPATASPAVDASVQVMNPKNFSAMPSIFSPITPAGDLFDQGASAGDPGHTRINQMYLQIGDLGDCSGLDIFRIYGENVGPPSASFYGEAGIAGGVNKLVPAPVNPNGGISLFEVYVFDRANNSQRFRSAIIYDPSDTDGNENNGDNGLGRPVMDVQATTITPDNNTLTILRQLTINEISVTDNLYRRGQVIPNRYTNTQTPADNGTNQYWGLWIAVEYLGKGAGATTTYPALTGGALGTLRWQPVEVRNASGTPAVAFNMFDGVLDRTATPNTNGFGPDLTKDGTYRVYVKALDGAGNASETTYTTTMTLAPGYQVITHHLPTILR